MGARAVVVEEFVEGSTGDTELDVDLFPLFREVPREDFSLDRRRDADTAGLP